MAYIPCPGSLKVAVEPYSADTANLGAKFMRNHGRRYGKCSHCQHGLALCAGDLAPNHKERTDATRGLKSGYSR